MRKMDDPFPGNLFFRLLFRHSRLVYFHGYNEGDSVSFQSGFNKADQWFHFGSVAIGR